MKYKFYSPYIVWFGIWVFICFVVSLITLANNRLYLESSLAVGRLLDQSGPYGEFAGRFGYFQAPLDRYQYPSGLRQPLRAPSDRPLLSLFPGADSGDRRGKGLSFGLAHPPSFPETPGLQRDWLEAWQHAARASYFVTLFSYFLFVVGFGAICLISAIYQNHFRRAQEEGFAAEIEARNLRIQMLESNRDSLDLKLKLLDQERGRALTAAQEAQENIRDMEERLHSEADRNEELQGELQKALREETKLAKMVHSLDRDRQKIAAEKMDILTRLQEAEKLAQADLYLQRIRKAKGRLRLNSFWLTCFYKNLSFSPRALQNITEIQEAPDIFPSLPDALARLDNTGLEALLSGKGLPPKSLARYTTPAPEHFQGPFWEYRFSADGRIFFGLSKSRTWSIDTILLKRRFPDKKEKYDRYLAATLGKDNQDLQPEIIS